MLQGLWQPSGKLFLSRLVPIDNARPLLLGNIANLFLDEWIHAGEEEPDYIDCMKKAFRQYPIELAACAELRDPSKEKELPRIAGCILSIYGTLYNTLFGAGV